MGIPKTCIKCGRNDRQFRIAVQDKTRTVYHAKCLDCEYPKPKTPAKKPKRQPPQRTESERKHQYYLANKEKILARQKALRDKAKAAAPTAYKLMVRRRWADWEQKHPEYALIHSPLPLEGVAIPDEYKVALVDRSTINPLEQAEQSELRNKLNGFMSLLSEQQQQVVETYADSLSLEETSKTTGLTEEQVLDVLQSVHESAMLVEDLQDYVGA